MNGLKCTLLPPGGKTATNSWSTPEALLKDLHAEFGFTLDPCPLDDSPIAGAGLFGKDGLLGDWRGHRVFVNPPYSDIGPWIARCRDGECVVYLVPARTDTAWWHEWALKADEVRFLRGRLKFGGATTNAPFPSAVLVYRNEGRP